MTIETLIEKSVDELIAVLVVGSAVYRVGVEPLIPIPEWHCAAVGMVLMYYFGRKIRNSAKSV